MGGQREYEIREHSRSKSSLSQREVEVSIPPEETASVVSV